MEFWFSEFHTPDVKHSIRVNKQLYSKQSDYQRIDIFETPEFGRVLTLDGNVMLTERDEFIYDEMIVHVPMAVHREAKDILVIGAGDGGVVRELTRYDRVERIDLVEMDPQVVEACRAYLPGNACRMDDRRVHIYFENALKYIRRAEEPRGAPAWVGGCIYATEDTGHHHRGHTEDTPRTPGTTDTPHRHHRGTPRTPGTTDTTDTRVYITRCVIICNCK